MSEIIKQYRFILNYADDCIVECQPYWVDENKVIKEMDCGCPMYRIIGTDIEQEQSETEVRIIRRTILEEIIQ